MSLLPRVYANMPYQNRVNPFGELVADPSKGTMLGNRGCLHDDHGQIRGRRWTTRSWVACKLDYKGRKQTIMAPGAYTQLFFLDEATALAAGHRPCAECRRSRFNAFSAAWRIGNATAMESKVRVTEIDLALHRERITPIQWRSLAPPRSLPDGVMVTSRRGGQVSLKWRDRLYPWSFAGYGAAFDIPSHTMIVVTPESTVRVLRGGYEIEVHPTLIRT